MNVIRYLVLKFWGYLIILEEFRSKCYSSILLNEECLLKFKLKHCEEKTKRQFLNNSKTNAYRKCNPNNRRYEMRQNQAKFGKLKTKYDIITECIIVVIIIKIKSIRLTPHKIFSHWSPFWNLRAEIAQEPYLKNIIPVTPGEGFYLLESLVKKDY